jgi:hypothetical protein
VNLLAATINVPVVDPAAIVSELAAMATLPVPPRLTIAPPAPAGLLRVTVQVAEAPWLNEAGLHARERTVTGTIVTRPPAAAKEIPAPLGSDARAPLTPMTIAADPETVAETVATTPFAIAIWFGPLATHANVPGLAAHVNDFPAAVNDGPAVTEMLVRPEG